MKKPKISNEQVLTELAQLSTSEAELNGVTPGLQAVAAQAANGDLHAQSLLYTPDTAIYNAFVGFIVKRAVGGLSSATYSDVYSRHHRNMIDGRPTLGFMKPATAGTGNTSKQFDASAPAFGTLTTVSTATQPTIVYLYEEASHAFVARVPVSPEDVKTAVITSDGGIENLIVKTRKAAEDKIIEDRNEIYDDVFEAIIDDGKLVALGAGAESSANAGSATKLEISATAEEVASAILGDYSALSEETLTKIYTAVKSVYNGITGRPSEKYNALGVKNNADRGNVFYYVDSDLQAEMDTRIASATYHLDKLEQDGLYMRAMKAPYLTKQIGEDDAVCIGVLGSVDFVRDWPTSDFDKTVEVDRGQIYNRFFDCVSAVCGYEPCVYLVLVVAGPAPSKGGYAITNGDVSSMTASDRGDVLVSYIPTGASVYFEEKPDHIDVGIGAADITVTNPNGETMDFEYTGAPGPDIIGFVTVPGVYTVESKS